MEFHNLICVTRRFKNKSGWLLLILLVLFFLPLTVYSTTPPKPGSGAQLPDSYFEFMQDKSADNVSAGGWRKKAALAKIEREKFLLERKQRIARGELSPKATLTPNIIPLTAQVTGNLILPVIPVTFSNRPATTTSADLQGILFGATNDTGNLTDYYSEVSYGRLQVTGTVFNLVNLPGTDDQYEGVNNGLPGGIKEMIFESITQSDVAMDFSQFDNDGPDGIPNSGDDDGYVDLVVFVHPESGGECSAGSTNIWSHYRQYKNLLGAPLSPILATNDASNSAFTSVILINDYTIQPARNCNDTAAIDIGVFAHETGHALGLPDLYEIRASNDTDTRAVSEGLGFWSLMASGGWNSTASPAHLDAWSKSELGWVVPDLTTKTTATTYNIPQVETNQNNSVFEISISNSEYYLIENRQAVGF